MTETELLAGLAAHPWESERWLILADWLEDQQDPRAELARLRWHYHYEPGHRDFEARRQRMVNLAAGVAPLVPAFTNSLGMRFALIPPGSFWMGSPDTQAGRDGDETYHRVTLTQPYFLGCHPVTVGEFQRFVEATGYRTEPERGEGAEGYINGSWRRETTITWQAPGYSQKRKLPVVCITWKDALAMVDWVNRQEASSGRIYALPTEAQWEFACRAGTETMYFWGDQMARLKEYAWYRDNSRAQAHSVASKKPNPWGLYHMAGLVWEWGEDWYGHIGPETVTNPTGAADGAQRVLRGGSWHVTPGYCRSADRSYDHPDDADSHTGFRIAAYPA